MNVVQLFNGLFLVSIREKICVELHERLERGHYVCALSELFFLHCLCQLPGKSIVVLFKKFFDQLLYQVLASNGVDLAKRVQPLESLVNLVERALPVGS